MQSYSQTPAEEYSFTPFNVDPADVPEAEPGMFEEITPEFLEALNSYKNERQ